MAGNAPGGRYDIGTYPVDNASVAALLGVRPYYRNFTPDKFRRWRLAKANAAKGLGFAKILTMGDSTTRGTQNSLGNQQAKNAYPADLAAMLSNSGVQAKWQSVIGGGSAADPINSDDDRITFSGSTVLSAVTSMGGLVTWLPSSGAKFDFAPSGSFDTIDIYYCRGTTNGSFTVGVDGGEAISTVNSNGTNGPLKTTVTTTLGTHVVNLAWASGGSCYIIGVDCYDSTTKSIRILNCGWPGSFASDLVASGTYSSWNTFGLVAADLTIVDIGINHWANSSTYPVSSYQANLATLVDKITLSSDIILKTPVPSRDIAVATQQGYVDAMIQVGMDRSLPIIDGWRRWDPSNPLSSFYDDMRHPNTPGYSDVAEAIFHGLRLAA